MGLECLLLTLTLCRAVKSKPIATLAVVQTAAQLADDYTTRGVVNAGGWEANPVSRVIIGRYPTWQRMVPQAVGLVGADAWLAELLRSSSNKWARRLWWVPQVVQIGANIAAVPYNARLSRTLARR
jgi:hypothetical protein